MITRRVFHITKMLDSHFHQEKWRERAGHHGAEMADAARATALPRLAPRGS